MLTSCAPAMIQTGGIDPAALALKAAAAEPSLNHASFCQVAKPIGYSSRDTDRTLLEITQHNCVGHKLCGWKVGTATCPADP